MTPTAVGTTLRAARQAGFMTADGDLGRPVAEAGWTRPQDIQVHGDEVRYGPALGGFGPTQGETVASDKEMLVAFLRLGGGEASDSQVQRFADRYGVLELCGVHKWLPRTHIPERYWTLGDEAPCCRPAGGRPGSSMWWEPVSRWVALSRQARAVLNVASRLARPDAQPVPVHLFPQVLDELIPVPLEYFLRGEQSVKLQRRILALAVEKWLEWGDVRVSYRWDRDHAQLAYGGASLFGSLATQLAVAVAKAESLVICDECGVIYAPKRAYRPGMPRRCPRRECRQLAAKREYARRRRAAQSHPAESTGSADG